MNKKIKMCFGIGAPSIIMIFISLSLTTMAILSLVTANSNYKLAQKHAEFITNYYAADTEIQEKLSTLSKDLNEGNITDQFVYDAVINDKQSIEIICDVTGKNFEILSQKIIVTEDFDYDSGYKYDDTIVK